MAVSQAPRFLKHDGLSHCCQNEEEQTDKGYTDIKQLGLENKRSVYSPHIHSLRSSSVPKPKSKHSNVYHMDKYNYSSVEENRTFVRPLSSTLDEQSHCSFSDQNVTVKPASIVENITISDAKMKVHSRIQLRRKVKVRKICPLNNGHSWVLQHDSSYLILIDYHGDVIKNSVRLHKNTIRDAAVMTTGHIVVTTYKHTIKVLWPDGASSSTFVDIQPYFANGLCTTVTDDVLVCKYHHCRNCQVVRYGRFGNVVQVIEYSSDGRPLFSFPYRITCLNNDHIVVVNKKEKDHKIVSVDCKGNLIDKWKGERNDFFPTCITRDREDNIYITDHINDQIYKLHTNSTVVTQLVDFKYHKMRSPSTVAVNREGNIILGCNRGKIYMLVEDQAS